MQRKIMKHKMSVYCDHYFHRAVCRIRRGLHMLYIFTGNVGNLQCDAHIIARDFRLIDQSNVGQDHSGEPHGRTRVRKNS